MARPGMRYLCVMKIRQTLVLLLLLSLAGSLRAQEVTLSGFVKDAESSEAVAGASIAILGTSRGAVANKHGEYRLRLEAAQSYTLRVTAVGYRPDTLAITVTQNTSRDFPLKVSPVTSKPITVTADQSRVEARRIMRKVIETKDTWQPLIRDHTFDVYARLNARSISKGDTNILSIIESRSKGYWDKERGYAERILARKQTANLPASANAFSVIDIINFYDERIDVPEYSIVSPVARDAFDRYDYDLLGTVEIKGADAYKILVEPRGAILPAFEGEVYIDKADHTLVYLSLSPNKAVKFGPLKETRIVQTFRFVDNKYWMPDENRLFLGAEFQLPFIPKFTVEHVAVMQNYSINAGIPDSIFEHKRLVDTLADKVDSIQWAQMRVIPLNNDEAVAYRVIDSVQALPKPKETFSIINTGIGLLLGGTPFSFNRVEGSRFEIGTRFTNMGGWPFSIGGIGAYGTADKRFKYDVSASQALLWNTARSIQSSIGLSGDLSTNVTEDIDPLLSLGLRMYDDLERQGDVYPKIFNTLTALLFRSDYPDYFQTKGGYAELEWTPGRTTELSLRFINERQESVNANTDFTFFNRDLGYRENPVITPGLLRSIALGVHKSFYWLGQNISLSLNALASDSAFGSNFTFSSASLGLEYSTRLGAWGRTTAKGKYSRVITGIPGVQHLIDIESRNAYFATTDVFRTMGRREFRGDRMWYAMLEHDFHDLPVRALGLTFLEPFDLHWIGFANIAETSLTDKNRVYYPQVQTTGLKPYVEAGLGLSNIFNLLRIEASWRLTHKREQNGFVTLLLNTGF